MGKVSKGWCCKSGSLHNTLTTPYLKKGIHKSDQESKRVKCPKRKAWKGVTCPICLESPHNAVLLLCSSYHKGCRPYMCATSSRFSNCLDQYKKAYAKDEETETPPQLLCPLCRSQVKGWTVVEDARMYMNSRKRICMQDDCSFVGSYRQLRTHVKAVHPRAQPRAVDPVLEEKWKKLECEQERSDVISTILSSTPGAMVLGDYVIEPFNDVSSINNDGNSVDDLDSEGSMEDEFFDLGSPGGQNDLFTGFNVSRVVPARFSGTFSRRELRRMLFSRRWWGRNQGRDGSRGQRRQNRVS